MTPTKNCRQRRAQLMRQSCEKLVLVSVCRFRFGARGLFAPQQTRALFLGLFANGDFHAQLGSMRLRLGIQSRVFISDGHVRGEVLRQSFISFSELIRVFLVQQIEPAARYRAANNRGAEERMEIVSFRTFHEQ